MIGQHYLGALLCWPALFGWCEPRLGQALVCIGALSELGWEWQDLDERIYRRYFTENGKIKEPNMIFYLTIIHHTFGLLILPMNLYYYDEYYYWEMVSLQQFAAAASYSLAEYTNTLDTTKRNGLRNMQWANIFGFFFVLWSRGFQFLWVAYNLLLVLMKDLSGLELSGVIFVTLCFSIFNLEACIMPFYDRMVKFNKKKAEKQDYIQLSEQNEEDC